MSNREEVIQRLLELLVANQPFLEGEVNPSNPNRASALEFGGVFSARSLNTPTNESGEVIIIPNTSDEIPRYFYLNESAAARENRRIRRLRRRKRRGTPAPIETKYVVLLQNQYIWNSELEDTFAPASTWGGATYDEINIVLVSILHAQQESELISIPGAFDFTFAGRLGLIDLTVNHYRDDTFLQSGFTNASDPARGFALYNEELGRTTEEGIKYWVFPPMYDYTHRMQDLTLGYQEVAAQANIVIPDAWVKEPDTNVPITRSVIYSPFSVTPIMSVRQTRDTTFWGFGEPSRRGLFNPNAGSHDYNTQSGFFRNDAGGRGRDDQSESDGADALGDFRRYFVPDSVIAIDRWVVGQGNHGLPPPAGEVTGGIYAASIYDIGTTFIVHWTNSYNQMVAGNFDYSGTEDILGNFTWNDGTAFVGDGSSVHPNSTIDWDYTKTQQYTRTNTTMVDSNALRVEATPFVSTIISSDYDGSNTYRAFTSIRKFQNVTCAGYNDTSFLVSYTFGSGGLYSGGHWTDRTNVDGGTPFVLGTVGATQLYTKTANIGFDIEWEKEFEQSFSLTWSDTWDFGLFSTPIGETFSTTTPNWSYNSGVLSITSSVNHGTIMETYETTNTTLENNLTGNIIERPSDTTSAGSTLGYNVTASNLLFGRGRPKFYSNTIHNTTFTSTSSSSKQTVKTIVASDKLAIFVQFDCDFGVTATSELNARLWYKRTFINGNSGQSVGQYECHMNGYNTGEGSVDLGQPPPGLGVFEGALWSTNSEYNLVDFPANKEDGIKLFELRFAQDRSAANPWALTSLTSPRPDLLSQYVSFNNRVDNPFPRIIWDELTYEDDSQIKFTAVPNTTWTYDFTLDLDVTVSLHDTDLNITTPINTNNSIYGRDIGIAPTINFDMNLESGTIDLEQVTVYDILGIVDDTGNYPSAWQEQTIHEGLDSGTVNITENDSVSSTNSRLNPVSLIGEKFWFFEKASNNLFYCEATNIEYVNYGGGFFAWRFNMTFDNWLTIQSDFFYSEVDSGGEFGEIVTAANVITMLTIDPWPDDLVSAITGFPAIQPTRNVFTIEEDQIHVTQRTEANEVANRNWVKIFELERDMADNLTGNIILQSNVNGPNSLTSVGIVLHSILTGTTPAADKEGAILKQFTPLTEL